MARQLTEAYVIAATRTAARKAPQGHVPTTHDTLLAHVLKSVVAQVPGARPRPHRGRDRRLRDPEYEQGMNVARIGVLLAGLLRASRG